MDYWWFVKQPEKIFVHQMFQVFEESHTTVGCEFVSISFACNWAVIVAAAKAAAVGIWLATGWAEANRPSGGVIAFPTRRYCPKQ